MKTGLALILTTGKTGREKTVDKNLTIMLQNYLTNGIKI